LVEVPAERRRLIVAAVDRIVVVAPPLAEPVQLPVNCQFRICTRFTCTIQVNRVSAVCSARGINAPMFMSPVSDCTSMSSKNRLLLATCVPMDVVDVFFAPSDTLSNT
jgi:hypothetical protein